MNEKSAIRIFSIIIFISAVMILTATVLFIVHERKAYYLKVDGMDKPPRLLQQLPPQLSQKFRRKKRKKSWKPRLFLTPMRSFIM